RKGERGTAALPHRSTAEGGGPRTMKSPVLPHPGKSAGMMPVSLLLAALAGLLSGCGNLGGVHPWQRELLTTYVMRPDRDPLAGAMAEHIYFSREAASGGRGVGGSGCGCN